MHFNYIFSGGGLSTLMTLIKLSSQGLLENKKVLIIDPDKKNQNDRTWCYWEKENGNWDFLVSKKWNKANFINKKNTIECLKNDYKYKMIESINFYNYAIEILKYQDIEWKYEKVISYEDFQDHVKIKAQTMEYTADILFNSVIDLKCIKHNSKFPFLQQHFIGWFIKTDKPAFNPDEAIFMDFSIKQNGNTRFMYVLPKTENEALIEYTLFSPNILEEQEYENEIQNYLKARDINDFEVLNKEQGNIPMTTYPLWKNNSTRILNIGSAGGWTKPSTGYTFKNTDKETSRIVDFIFKKEYNFKNFKKATKFTFYDDLFVDVLYKENHLGYKIFSKMFINCDNKIIFKFLDEETNILEDLKVIWSCPKTPFIKSLTRRLFKK